MGTTSTEQWRAIPCMNRLWSIPLVIHFTCLGVIVPATSILFLGENPGWFGVAIAAGFLIF